MDSSGRIRGYVLAGGGSTRFGQDKALVEFNGQPMLLRMRDLLKSLLNRVDVIAAPGKYASIGIESIADLWPGEGPLGGIITAISVSGEERRAAEWNLIVGCDLPFLSREWLAYMTQRAMVSTALVIVPQSPGGLEPLCACWRTDALAKLRHSFENGVRKITDAMKELDAEVVDYPAWKQFDTEGRLFWNMNTPADYDEAQRVLKAERT